jgi:hypothetical protein
MDFHSPIARSRAAIVIDFYSAIDPSRAAIVIDFYSPIATREGGHRSQLHCADRPPQSIYMDSGREREDCLVP